MIYSYMKHMLGVSLFIVFSLFSTSAFAFGDSKGSCGADCTSCHKISIKEAEGIVKKISPEIEVLEIKPSLVRGLWEIVVKSRGRKALAYVDFSKRHIITGSIIEVDTKENLSEQRLYEISKIDISQIPLNEAIVMGNPEARLRAIVFEDPDCAYCRKLHKEIRKILDEREDIVFFIKLLPLKIHPASYKKSQSIVCEKSVKLLERAFDGKDIPESVCEKTEIDDNIEMSERLGISGTPSIVLQDGALIGGFKEAQTLVKMMEEAAGIREGSVSSESGKD